jgi:hypothetical protein
MRDGLWKGERFERCGSEGLEARTYFEGALSAENTVKNLKMFIYYE